MNWSECLSEVCVETAVSSFYSIIEDIISTHVPTRIVHDTSRYPVWFSPALIKVVKEKLKFHRKWKRYKNYRDYSSFCRVRERQKALEDKVYDEFIENAENSIIISSKNFWTFIKSKKRAENLPDRLCLNDCYSSDGKEICEMFNTHFNSAFNLGHRSLPPPNNNTQQCTLNISSIQISAFTIQKYLKLLDVSKGAGPDNIPPLFFRNCFEQLSVPLLAIFNMSLQTGIMPKVWKRSFVIPTCL